MAFVLPLPPPSPAPYMLGYHGSQLSFRCFLGSRLAPNQTTTLEGEGPSVPLYPALLPRYKVFSCPPSLQSPHFPPPPPPSAPGWRQRLLTTSLLVHSNFSLYHPSLMSPSLLLRLASKAENGDEFSFRSIVYKTIFKRSTLKQNNIFNSPT